MDSELTIAVAAALDPILLIIGLVIGSAISRWPIRLLIGFGVAIGASVILRAHSEPWATIGRSIGMLIGIAIGDWLRNKRKRAKVG